MKKISILLFFLLITNVFGEDALSKYQKSKTITIGFANEIPYGYKDANGELKGEAPTVALAILKKLGITNVKAVVTEFGSLIPGLKAGRFDMISAGMYITPKRCRQVLFSNPTYAIGESFLVKKGNPKNLHSFEDVAKNDSIKLGVMAGAIESTYAKKTGIKRSQTINFPDYPSGLAALKTGRIDALAGTHLTMLELAKKEASVQQALPFKDPIIEGKEVKGYGAFGFRKNEPSMKKAFDKELAKYLGTKEHIEAVSVYGFGKATLTNGKTSQELCGK
jgi:polar amino acid transport system substrate-binding protein